MGMLREAGARHLPDREPRKRTQKGPEHLRDPIGRARSSGGPSHRSRAAAASPSSIPLNWWRVPGLRRPARIATARTA